jgi:hypothetical protein
MNAIGIVRAQHQHLAVGHVDDAQQAERDRQPERREEQHAGQRQPVQKVAHQADHPLVRDDRVTRLAGRRPHTCVRLVRRAVAVLRQDLLKRRQKVLVDALADELDRRQARRRIGAPQIDPRDRQRERLAYLGVVLASERPPQEGGRLGRAAVRQLLRRRQPHGGVRGSQLELGQDGKRHPPHLVADLHLLERARRRADHRAREGIPDVADLAVPDVGVSVGAEAEPIVAQGVQRRDRARVTEHGQLVDALVDLVVGRGGQPVDGLLERAGLRLFQRAGVGRPGKRGPRDCDDHGSQ